MGKKKTTLKAFAKTYEDSEALIAELDKLNQASKKPLDKANENMEKTWKSIYDSETMDEARTIVYEDHNEEKVRDHVLDANFPIVSVETIKSTLVRYADHLSAENNNVDFDYVRTTEWENGEGWDVEMKRTMDREAKKFELTWGEFKALKAAIGREDGT